MKNQEPEMITLPINAAHLMSLSGMLREFAPETLHSIFSAQVAHQAGHQGLNVFDLKPQDYDLMMDKTLNFSIPANCIADVGNILMNAAKDEANEGMNVALNFLIQVWVPFAKAAIVAIEDSQIQPFHPRNRISDFGPEDLN